MYYSYSRGKKQHLPFLLKLPETHRNPLNFTEIHSKSLNSTEIHLNALKLQMVFFDGTFLGVPAA